MATMMREVEIEFDEEDAVALLDGATLVNTLIDREGSEAVLDEIPNDVLADYLSYFDGVRVFTNDADYCDSAVETVVDNAALLERVLHAVPLSTLAEVLESMGGTV